MFSKKTTVKLMFPAFALGAFFAACSNGESISDSKVESVAEADSLPECDSTYEGEMVLVKSDSSIHVCVNKEWTKITQNSDGSYDYDGDKDCSLKQVDINQLQIKCGTDSMTFFVQGGSDAANSSLSAESASSFELKGASISGNAIKGPYEVSAVATLKEMQIQGDSLSYTGRSYTGSVSGLKGSFVIPNVALDYPYAEVAVTGKWLNEVTGDLSSEEMTLYALADLSDGSTEVNVNILTHVEYERVKVLVKKGYDVKAAKKQAENEIMSALGFSTNMGYFEKLSAFDSGSDINKEAANATLLAISLLFIRDNDTDAKIKESLQKFADDIASDGKWNDADGEKKKMAIWAENFDVRATIDNIKAWGVSNVPEYDKYFAAFWNNYYGLGSCSIMNKGDVKIAKKNDNGSHYICKNGSFWNVATAAEWEAYDWKAPKENEPKGRAAESGNVYIYDEGLAAWRVPDNDFEYDTYDFTIPRGVEDKAKMGHKTKQCYVYEKLNSEDDNSTYVWTVEPDEIADTFFVSRSDTRGIFEEDAIVGAGGCTGKPYARTGNNLSWLPATDMEGYVGYACSEALGTLNKLVSHRYATSPTAKDSVFVCKNSGWTWLRNAEYTLGSLKDTRDNNVYTTAKIGNQNWMAEDLRYCTFEGYQGAYCAADMQESDYRYEQLSFICPEGWHVPSKEEFEALLVYVSGASSIDKIDEDDNNLGLVLGALDGLSVATMSESEISNTAFNKYGFSAKRRTYWTSSTNTDGDEYYVLDLYQTNAKFKLSSMPYMPAVRCIEDTPKK